MSIHDGHRNRKIMTIGWVAPHFMAPFALPDESASVGQENSPQLRIKRLPHRSADFALGQSLLKLKTQAQGTGQDGERIRLNAIRRNILNTRHQRIEARRFCNQMQRITLGNPHPVVRVVDHSHDDCGGKWEHVIHAVNIADLTAARNSAALSNEE